MEKQRSLIVKIIIPVLIVALIGGMWLVKNQKEQADVTDDNTLLQTEVELPESLEGADFGLREQDAIDFEELASFGLPAIIDYGADSCIPCKGNGSRSGKGQQGISGKSIY